MTFEHFQDDIACARFMGMERNLCSKIFSDFQIVCGEHTFYVHRIVLAHRCDYFWTITTSEFMEAQRQVAHFPDDDPSLIARLIYFTYTGKLLTKPLVDTKIEQFEDVDDPYMCEDQSLMLAANVYSMAVKYGATDLARLASCLFRTSIDTEFHLLADWTQLVAYVYESTPSEARELRNVVVRRLQRNVLDCKKNTWPGVKETTEVVSNVPGLAIDLALIHFTESNYRCTECAGRQPVLELLCTHGKMHEPGDAECFALNLEKQECQYCHEIGMLTRDYSSPSSNASTSDDSSSLHLEAVDDW